MNLVVLGSRTFQPVRLGAAAANQHDVASVTAIGKSPVALAAAAMGEARRLPTTRVALDQRRELLLQACRQPDARVLAFVAREANGEPTAGMGMLLWTLNDAKIAYERVDSACPPAVCELVTKLLGECDKAANYQPDHWMTKKITATLLELGAEADGLAKRYHAKLESGWRILDAAPDAANETRWLGWLAAYESLLDALKRADGALSGKRNDHAFGAHPWAHEVRI